MFVPERTDELGDRCARDGSQTTESAGSTGTDADVRIAQRLDEPRHRIFGFGPELTQGLARSAADEGVGSRQSW